MFVSFKNKKKKGANKLFYILLVPEKLYDIENNINKKLILPCFNIDFT